MQESFREQLRFHLALRLWAKRLAASCQVASDLPQMCSRCQHWFHHQNCRAANWPWTCLSSPRLIWSRKRGHNYKGQTRRSSKGLRRFLRCTTLPPPKLVARAWLWNSCFQFKGGKGHQWVDWSHVEFHSLQDWGDGEVPRHIEWAVSSWGESLVLES